MTVEYRSTVEDLDDLALLNTPPSEGQNSILAKCIFFGHIAMFIVYEPYFCYSDVLTIKKRRQICFSSKLSSGWHPNINR